MDEKVKELIAVGASVSAHCQPCLTFHVAKAKEMGIEESEIRQAIAGFGGYDVEEAGTIRRVE